MSHWLDPHQDTLRAVVDLVYPPIGDGLGAVALGVVDFIAGQLDTPWGRGERSYLSGPVQRAPHSGHGAQTSCPPRGIVQAGLDGLDGAARSAFGSRLVSLTRDQQVGLLTSCQQGELTVHQEFSSVEFFALLRSLVMEGALSHPRHGGNRDGAGWAWIGMAPNDFL